MTLLEKCTKEIFQQLWSHYISMVPEARRVESSLRDKKDTWSEDHVAFRTFPGQFTGMHILGGVFEALGYKKRDHYFFKDKQLNAFWYEPPHTEERHSSQVSPKVFVSELILDEFPESFQKIIKKAVGQVTQSPLPMIQQLAKQVVSTNDATAAEELIRQCVSFMKSGAPWARPVQEDYECLRAKSEYAAWTLVFGFSINHFTVSVHLMKSFKSIDALNKHISDDLKIAMNQTGGITKGSPEVQLEQSSTLASQVPIAFQDGVKTLPYAFVEFAYRYPLQGQSADGLWESYYQGFVTDNADKIFESTNKR